MIGIEIEGNNLGYPLSISNWHEISNDTIFGVSKSITIYPRCGTGLAFRGDFVGAVATLGVSGLQYNIDILLYDRQSKSLWSHVMGQAVNGPLKDEHLVSVPIEHTT